MRMVSLVIAIITVVLLLSTLLCGSWIHAKGLATDVEATAFHMKIGIASVVFGLLTAALLILKLVRP